MTKSLREMYDENQSRLEEISLCAERGERALLLYGGGIGDAFLYSTRGLSPDERRDEALKAWEHEMARSGCPSSTDSFILSLRSYKYFCPCTLWQLVRAALEDECLQIKKMLTVDSYETAPAPGLSFYEWYKHTDRTDLVAPEEPFPQGLFDEWKRSVLTGRRLHAELQTRPLHDLPPDFCPDIRAWEPSLTGQEPDITYLP